MTGMNVATAAASTLVRSVTRRCIRRQQLPRYHSSLADILRLVETGKLGVDDAASMILRQPSSSPDDTLQSFANLDHSRAKRTGFPEAVFAQKQFEAVSKIPLSHGSIEYHDVARIISMKASGISETSAPSRIEGQQTKVVIACAGTTDLPIAEEAAVTLEAAGCEITRVYDAGVAGLHRIINALPKLRDPQVGCVIVCAGMDGALPSVVGGLVSVPVIAVPTSIGYGASFGGISAMLTMLNSCAPGGVVNIDNGFGAAALPTSVSVANSMMMISRWLSQF
ncbi:AIR carboxylase [Fragilaria crotonensis]|nr:AIR carboxylase [Fragilaria crotonensis]